jgi:hypothetical protein
LLDNTPLLASRVLASGMMAGVSSPARPWFRLRIGTDIQTNDPQVRAWLEEVQKRMLHVFAKSNLYNCLHTLYGELGAFGTAALWVDEDEEDIVRGYTLTVGEYWLATDKRLAITTLYRSIWWSVKQIVDTFGREKVSAGIRALFDAGQLDTEYEIIHAIEPNPNAAPPAMRVPMDNAFPWRGTLATRMACRSVWFERSQQAENALLRVSGYEEFAAMCPRWDITGTETYGYGPGWDALGDGQGLQSIERRSHEVADKLSKPPMVGTPELINRPASLLPGGVTITKDGVGSFKPAVEMKPEALNALSQKSTQMQERINKAYYVDLFRMMMDSDRRDITAREVDEKHEEKMLMLGPVLERLHDELLGPLVERVFNIMMRNGMFPPAPQSVSGPDLQVEFISLLAQAQKAVSTSAIERFWQFGMQIGQVKPEALDRLDPDGTMESYADMTGVPNSALVSRRDADARRAQKAKQAQQAQGLETIKALSEAGKNASDIDVGGGQNVISSMAGAG